MADNTQLNIATTLGDIIATDDIGGVKHELVKIEFGADGVATMVDAANPLPVSVIGGIIVGSEVEIKNDAGNPVSVSAASLPLPAGAAIAANQQTDALTDLELRASAVVVTGTVTTTPTDVSALSKEATQLLVQAKTDNLDVALSTLLKPADTLTKVTTVDTITNVVHVDDNAGSLTVDGTVAVSNMIPSVETGLAKEVTLQIIDGKVTLDADTGIKVHVQNTTPSGTQDVNILSSVELEIKNDVNNPIPVTIPGLTTASYGQVDVPVTEVAVPVLANSKTTCIKALAANAQKVYVGKTGVSAANGFELGASDSVEIDTTDAVPWFMISSSGTQRICYIIVS